MSPAPSFLVSTCVRALYVGVLLSLTAGLSGQSVFEDARALRELLERAAAEDYAEGRARLVREPERARAILARYGQAIGVDGRPALIPVEELIYLNPFFTRAEDIEPGGQLSAPIDLSAILNISVEYTRDSVFSPSGGGPVARPFDPILRPNERPVAEYGNASRPFSAAAVGQGIATFLADRARQELSATFFERFRRRLEERPALAILFPSTLDQLDRIDDDIFGFNAYIEGLRFSFFSDLNTLPLQVRDLIVQHPETLDLAPGAQLLAEDALSLAQLLAEGEPLENLVAFLLRDSQLRDLDRISYLDVGPGAATVRTLSDLTTLLGFVGAELGVGPELKFEAGPAVSRFLSDPVSVNLLLGLLWFRAQATPLTNGSNLQVALSDLGERLRREAGVPATTGKHLRSLYHRLRELKELRDAPGDSTLADGTTISRTYRLSSSLSGALESAYALGIDLGLAEAENEAVPTALRSFRAANQLLFDVERGFYVAAVNDLLQLLDGISLREEGFAARKALLRYGTFIATVAEARTADGVAAAIETFALPPGSSRMKKNNRWSVALNGYVGAQFGREKLEQDTERADVFAVTAPVGINVNRGLGRGGSLSLYVTAIDVGAFTAYRLGGNATYQELPEFTWSNLFAPGGQLVYGLPHNLPVSVAVGYQQGPSLRRVSDDFADIVPDGRGGNRIMATVSVDIPITHFYTR